uniref:Ribosomal protein S1 n=2 Tax=Cycas TaxID=3395 RepID=A0A8F4MH02_CYCRE|nr:ribosomal protein S1 [Cycas taitungensis]QXE43873.1 ribosomal protein S1 [Cycas revoluta]BAF98408.1 ribosomal protein S1 [Cycas taitungensis]
MFLVDAGPGTPIIRMQDELTRVPINRAARFDNKVGSLDVVAGESLIKKRAAAGSKKVGSTDVKVAGESLIKERAAAGSKISERFFIDPVAGESLIKERAAARSNDLVGSTDVVAGEPLILSPQIFRQNRAWMEPNKIWRTNKKVKGFIIDEVKGGYSVAIAGFITPPPGSPPRTKRIANDQSTIENINPKRTNIVVK